LPDRVGGGIGRQNAVYAEAFTGLQLMRLGLAADLREEGLGHLSREQTPAVLREARRVEDRLRERQAHEPARQELVLRVLAEVALGGDCAEDLNKLRAQLHLGGDRGPATLGVERLEGGS
jgi:hypothetical protein